MPLQEKWVPAPSYGARNSSSTQWERQTLRTKKAAPLPEETVLKQKIDSMPKGVVENSTDFGEEQLREA